MITDVEYMQIVSEAFDLSDYATKKKVLFCNEAKKVDNIEFIVTRLYELIKADCTGIDFGSIPKSKGVVTRIDNYADLVDCINQVHELVRNYKEKTDIVDEISTALDNIHQRERQFTKAFTLNIELPIMIYNMTVLGIVSSVSLLLSSCVEYIKNGHDSFSVSFDKVGYYKSKDHVLYQYLTMFNRNCASKSMDKLIDDCIKNNMIAESVEEDEELEPVDEISLGYTLKTAGKAVLSGNKEKQAQAARVVGKTIVRSIKQHPVVACIIAAGAVIILFFRYFKYIARWYLGTRMKIADWFEIQAEFLQINAENLKYRDDDKGDDHKKQVYQNQMKWVERFKNIANKIAISDAKAKKEADAEANKKETPPDSDDGLF